MARTSVMVRCGIGLALVLSALLVAKVAELGPFAPEPSDRLGPEPMAGQPSDTLAPERAAPESATPERKVARPVPRLAVAELAAVGQSVEEASKRAERKLAGVFGDHCNFGVGGHCLEWNDLAARCDHGETGACVRLGWLLIEQSPMQPLWGALFLDKACALGNQDVCDAANQWREWSHFGYSPKPLDGQDPPPDLVDRCKEGGEVACGLLQMRMARSDESFDWQQAMSACRAGFRDVCAALLERASSAEQTVVALSSGCDLPDAMLCNVLADVYSDRCASLGLAAPCPPPSPTASAHYRKLACQLAPALCD